MSESELVQIAHLVGYPGATRQLTADELERLILGEREATLEDPVQPLREKTHQFVQRNRSIMASTMACNLDCPACPAREVVACYATNHDLVD